MREHIGKEQCPVGGFVQEAGESRRAIRRDLRLNVASPTRQADPDRLESSLFAGPQPEEQGISFLFRGLCEHLELTVRTDSSGETIAAADDSRELDIDANLRRGQGHHYVISRVARVKEWPSVWETGLPVLTETKCNFRRLGVSDPAQNHPQSGSRADEPAGGRRDPKPLGTAELLGGEYSAEPNDLRFTYIERCLPQLHLAGKNLYLAHPGDRTTNRPPSDR